MDFLIQLRHDEGLSVSAVKGYSFTLNSVLALKARDLASSRDITMLLRSFSRSVNPVELRPRVGRSFGSSELDWGSI